MRAAHVPITDHDRLDAMLSEEGFEFVLDLGILFDSRSHPALDDRFGTFGGNDRRSNLGRHLIVGAVEGDGTNGKLRLVGSAISLITAVFIFLAAPTRARGVSGDAFVTFS